MWQRGRVLIIRLGQFSRDNPGCKCGLFVEYQVPNKKKARKVMIVRWWIGGVGIEIGSCIGRLWFLCIGLGS